MARHAAPRSPRSPRRRLRWLAGFLGVAATVALGVLVAPHPDNLPLSHLRLPPVWEEPPRSDEDRLADLVQLRTDADSHGEPGRDERSTPASSSTLPLPDGGGRSDL